MAGIFMAISGIQLFILMATTPMYALDTNSYIRGILSWSVYHNPLSNIFIGILSKMVENAWFIVSVQILVYAASSSILIQSIFKEIRWMIPAALFAGWEPVTMFYNLSLLSESLFCSMTLLMVASGIRYFRSPGIQPALLFGVFAGLAFLARLSGNLYVALLFLIFFAVGIPFRKRLMHFGMAAGTYMLFYIFVWAGQSLINDGALYTVKGRVLWDFSSSQYSPRLVRSDSFNRLMAKRILAADSLTGDRELRREQAYLAYKDCLAEYEVAGNESGSIFSCDSLFGGAASQIVSQKAGAAFFQFVADNLYDIHNRSYLEERFTPGMHFYQDESEYHYLDSIMSRHYSLNLPEQSRKIPAIWRSLGFPTAWATLVFYLWIASLLLLLLIKIRGKLKWEILLPVFTVSLPVVFHLIYISYRLRFWGPVILLLLLSVLAQFYQFRKGGAGAGNAIGESDSTRQIL